MTTEEKLYREIVEIQSQIIVALMYKASCSVEYHKDKPEEVYKNVCYIADKSKWDYCGMVSKETMIKLELLEKLRD